MIVSTPDHWHAIQSQRAMNKDLHVCCEKAMTLNFEEGGALADAAKKSGVVFRLDSECRSSGYMIKTADLALFSWSGACAKWIPAPLSDFRIWILENCSKTKDSGWTHRHQTAFLHS